MRRIWLILTLLTFCSVSAQVIIEDPVVDVGNAWSVHQIESFHFTPHGGFAFLNDGSSWKINPSELEWVSENEDLLLNTPLTIMPEAGTEQYPLRIIVHSDKECGWVDFTVEYLSPPDDGEASYISRHASEDDEGLEIYVPLKETVVHLRLLINPHDSKTLTKWKKGQKVIIGGVWLPEYDLNGPKDYSSAYQYVLFNYSTGNYVFFSVVLDSFK